MSPSLFPAGIPGIFSASPATSAAWGSMTSRKKQPADISSTPSSSTATASMIPSFVAASPSEGGKIKMYSNEFYGACAVGGILSCGLTHTAVAPMDVVKCNMQTDPKRFSGIGTGFRLIVSEQGYKGLFKGWAPTLLGYSAQGACKFGFYEYFKKTYSDMAGPEITKKYQTLIYLAGSASAEFIADVALCPFEAVKVKVQTNPTWAVGLSDGMPKFVAQEGLGGLWKGVGPLWGRQIPYTMMKFGAFENTVVALYQYVIPKPKSQCTKVEQLGVSFLAGYIAGVFCAVVSQPADNLVSKLNANKGATVGDIVRDMGVVGLFTRGLVLRIAMVGTLTGLQWGIYDAFKVYVGLPTTGSVEKPVAVKVIEPPPPPPPSMPINGDVVPKK